MRHRWDEKAIADITVALDGPAQSDLRQRIYSARLLGNDPELVLHGGGNVSVKTLLPNVFGELAPVTLVKASGQDLATIGEAGFTALDHDYLVRLANVGSLSDVAMKDELMLHLARPHEKPPSIEALMHVFLAPKYVDHTHPASILALTNREGGIELITEVFGSNICVIPYAKPGFMLARAVAEAYERDSDCQGMILMHHGLITWGETAREAYDRTIDLVNRAEIYLTGATSHDRVAPVSEAATRSAIHRYRSIAPALRGAMIRHDCDTDHVTQRVVLRPIRDSETLGFLESDGGRELAFEPPLTPDNLIRTGMQPLWIATDDLGDEADPGQRLAAAVDDYSREYSKYYKRHGKADGSPGPGPKVVMLPGIGIVCMGRDVAEADTARDVTLQTVRVKATIAATGGRYQGLSEAQLYEMEYDPFQQAKLLRQDLALPSGTIALVTGAAGAIGSSICERLLQEGAHVAVTDLAGGQLDSLVGRLTAQHDGRVLAVPLDVTSEAAVAAGFESVVEQWGGLDLLVVNAGLAHVSTLSAMDLSNFRRLEEVNVEGTLLLLRQAAQLFGRQGAGGDVVVVSTKNVFAPGAGFGAYSATKAACHQLARIASLELAELDVRVNMVSPDAVFSHGDRKSGLWAEVGPDRMRARGLDEAGLQEYYRNRNLLKTKVTAEHVANAVMFFATRQTPTTGATIPVDGGLPDATPR
ncbi:MAG: bifunctional aldolase/short-chain dehydrogenase [Gemmatimonadota bacterium]|nr:MAG: bifunctional aldolase/short-chain dehydrogenase [Gemmatimonadota bacterium]